LLSGSTFKVGHGYVLGLPVAAYPTWQGLLLKGKGVSPDEIVELSYEALKEGRDSQMEKAIDVVRILLS
jgi:C-terminal processing protease CtpA/Prc